MKYLGKANMRNKGGGEDGRWAGDDDEGGGGERDQVPFNMRYRFSLPLDVLHDMISSWERCFHPTHFGPCFLFYFSISLSLSLSLSRARYFRPFLAFIMRFQEFQGDERQIGAGLNRVKYISREGEGFECVPLSGSGVSRHTDGRPSFLVVFPHNYRIDKYE